MPNVDVVIPTRNAPEVLSLCLSHYWLNAHDDQLVSSVVLFDNRSTASGMVAIQQEAMRRRAQVLIHDRNVGVWASVNRGLVLSRSEYVLVLTSDVLLGPNSLKNLVTAIEQYPELGVVGPEIRDGLESLSWLNERYSSQPTGVDLNRYNGACWLFRRSLIEEVGYFDPQFYVCYGDTDFIQRVYDSGWSCGVLAGARCIHLDKCSRRMDHSVDQDNEAEIRDAQRFRAKWKHRLDVLAKHPIPDRILYAMQKERYWDHSLTKVVV